MDKKIGQRSGGHSSQVKRPKQAPHGQRPSRSGRSHQARGAGHKGNANEFVGEEFDHHDLHEQEERRQESWQVQKTIQGEKDRDDQDDSKNKDSQAQQQMQARRQALRQNGNLLTQKGKNAKAAKKELPQVAATKRDGFEVLTKKKIAQLKKTEHAKLDVPLGPRIPPQQMTVAPHYLLKDVRDAGEFFEKLDADGRGGGAAQLAEDIDPEWLAAVRETARVLHGVRGISAVMRGLTDTEEPCVLVLTAPGLSTSTFETAIPAVVRGYPTLVAIPFDALPLRRERPLPSLSINP